jgi:Fic family protein
MLVQFELMSSATSQYSTCIWDAGELVRSYHPVVADPSNALNEMLKGSPYLLEGSEEGQKRAMFLLEESVRIEERERVVEDQFQKQSAEIRRRLDVITDARLVFESNALELTGLPLSDTEAEIERAPRDLEALREYVAQQAVKGDSHLVDVLGLHEANLFARMLAKEYAEEARPLREVDIRTLHQIAVPSEAFAGEYRSEPVTIAGSGHVPPHFSDVPRQMQELVAWLNETTSLPPLAASVVHSWLTIIHPFKDGNGRVARLLANVVLLRAGWPSLIVRSSDRLQYLDALAASDEGGDLLPLFDLFVKTIRYALNELERPDLAEKLFGIDLQRQPDQRFKVWARQLSEFLDVLRTEVTPKGFVLDRLAVPPASTMFLLEERRASGNTWLAKVRHRDGRDFLLWLGYMSTSMLDGSGVDRICPSIFVSKRDRRPDALHPYTNSLRDGSPVAIDEIALVPKIDPREALVRKRSYVSEESIADAARELARAFAGFRIENEADG